MLQIHLEFYQHDSRYFKETLILSPAKVELFTLTCCSLHNLLINNISIHTSQTCTMSQILQECKPECNMPIINWNN